LVIGILLIYNYYKSVDYALVFALTPFMQNFKIIFLSFQFDLLKVIAVFIFVGAVGKSAQLGLHT
jgi:NADH-ubiquinone oxidoreductase chain 5